MATIIIVAGSACILLAWWLAIRSEQKAFYKRLAQNNIRLPNDRRSNRNHASAKRPAHRAEQAAAGHDGKRADCGTVVRETHPQADQQQRAESG